jgi:hypothetical protein
MLVSLAVLSLALGIVGYVFSVTTKTASQATAYSQTHAWVREFTRQLQEDLAHCEPAQSVLVMVGRTQAAALTQDSLEAGKYFRVLVGNPSDPGLVGYDPEYAPLPDLNGVYSDPRADLLMFFSNRPTASAAPNPNVLNDPYANGVKFSPIRVVYGHAAFGQPVWNGSSYAFPSVGALSHIEQTVTVGPSTLSRLPATRWHLSRVATIVDPNVLTGTTWFSNNARGGGADPGAVPGGMHYYEGSQPMPGDGAFLDRAAFLTKCSDPTLLTVSTAPYSYPGAPWSSVAGLVNDIDSVVYGDPTLGTTMHHVATVLEDVPVDLKSNLAVHMLPGCVWFQVEFLMPEDPRNSATYFSDPNAPLMSRRSDMPRWMQVLPGQTYVFVPDTQQNRQALIADQDLATPGHQYAPRLFDFGRLDQDASVVEPAIDSVSQRLIRMWPYAIRVTVRVWDVRGVLPEPIVRTVMHRFE